MKMLYVPEGKEKPCWKDLEFNELHDLLGGEPETLYPFTRPAALIRAKNPTIGSAIKGLMDDSGRVQELIQGAVLIAGTDADMMLTDLTEEISEECLQKFTSVALYDVTFIRRDITNYAMRTDTFALMIPLSYWKERIEKDRCEGWRSEPLQTIVLEFMRSCMAEWIRQNGDASSPFTWVDAFQSGAFYEACPICQRCFGVAMVGVLCMADLKEDLRAPDVVAAPASEELETNTEKRTSFGVTRKILRWFANLMRKGELAKYGV